MTRRPAFLAPALAAGAATLVAVLIFNAVVDEDAGEDPGLPRQRIESVAPGSAPPGNVLPTSSLPESEHARSSG